MSFFACGNKITFSFAYIWLYKHFWDTNVYSLQIIIIIIFIIIIITEQLQYLIYSYH